MPPQFRASVADLGQNAARLGEHRKTMARTAARVGELARRAEEDRGCAFRPQIGDITVSASSMWRSLVLLDAYLAERGASQRDE